mmetsp:Transcript_25092/g.63876  ORF Transcript_25092/g.63876 Transcript_25092/m.63876 type:complete len:247 (-) Transcript_25092:351-1091(-)
MACQRDARGSSQLSTPALTPNCSRKRRRRKPRSTELTKMSERPGMRLSLKRAYMTRNLSWCEHRSQNCRSLPASLPPSSCTSTVSGLCRKSARIESRSGVMVAERRSVCTAGGSAAPMAAMSSPYPYESSRSASSTTRRCTLSLRASTRPFRAPEGCSMSWRSLAGVATMASGGASALSADESLAAARATTFTPAAPAWPSSLRMTPCTCWQSSRVGTSTIAPTPGAADDEPASCRRRSCCNSGMA